MPYVPNMKNNNVRFHSFPEADGQVPYLLRFFRSSGNSPWWEPKLAIPRLAAKWQRRWLNPSAIDPEEESNALDASDRTPVTVLDGLRGKKEKKKESRQEKECVGK